jgi:hypothetical protein
MPDVPNEFKETQAGLCEILDINPPTLNNWIARRDTTDFPEHVDQIGKYKFYDIREVRSWLELWMKATKNMNWRRNA